MNNENLVHIHTGILVDGRDNEIMMFIGKWVELENMPSEVTKMQKVKIFSDLIF